MRTQLLLSSLLLSTLGPGLAHAELPPPISEELQLRVEEAQQAPEQGNTALPQPLTLEVEKKDRYTLIDAALSPVVVTIRVVRLTGRDQRGKERVLFEDKSGINIPLEELPGIEAHINPRLVPRGYYRDLRMDFGGTYTVQSSNGHTLSLALDEIGAPLSIPMQGEVVQAYGKVRSNGLGFDIERFNQPLPQAISKLLAPSIEAGY